MAKKDNISAWLDKNEEVVKEQLAEAKDEKGFAQFDDGWYVGLVVVNELAESKGDEPKIGVKQAFCILEGEMIGELRYDWISLEREDGVTWVGRRLKALGVEIDPDEVLREMKKNRDDICGLIKALTTIKFRLRTKGEYQNIHEIKVLDPADYADEIKDALTLMKQNQKERDERKDKKEGKDSSKDKKTSEPDEDEEDSEDIAVGDRIKFMTGKGKNKKELEGNVTEINEDDETIKVKTATGDEHEIDYTEVIEVVDSEETDNDDE